MPLHTKRIIYSSFMLLFAAIAPLLILYTSGYRFNLKKGELSKTGVIFLETTPRQANIELNDKLVGTKTPLRLKNLGPNEYNLLISKAGYKSWEKIIPVFAGQTSFLQYVRLFKDSARHILLKQGLELQLLKDPGDSNRAVVIEQMPGGTATFSLLDLAV